MATGPKLVHKQFNSPIGLYSQNNIQETLNKHLKNLDNGTVGIDFSNPGTDKPTNLANSAVLRMLEEEERNRRGYPSQKKVVWPPVPETNGYHSPQAQQQRQPSPAYQNNAAQQQQHPQQQHHPQQQQYQQPPQHAPQSPQPQYQQHHQPYPQNPQSQPAYCEGKRQAACGLSKLIPVGPGVQARPVSPSPYNQGPTSPGVAPQPYRPAQGRWAPVVSPLSPQAYGVQPNYQQQHSPQLQQQQHSPQQQQQQQYSPQQQQYPPQQQSPLPQYSPQQQQQYQPQQQQQYPPYEYQQPQRQFEPPPSTITLRQSTPVHQQPPPVYASQPAAASYKDSISSDPSGGVNMRGDQKWPPQEVREAVAAENETRRQIARGPACRPRKVKKDYSSFFAQNRLNNNYPGYRAPPGTQHYEDYSGRSSY